MTSIQPFDSDAYLTDVFPTIFENAQSNVEPVFSQAGGLVTQVPSTTAQNIYSWLSQSPGFREWFGERQIKELTGNEFILKNKKFEETLGVDMDDLEDLSKIASISMWVQKLGESAGQHPDELLWSYLENEALSVAHYDGVPLLSASHPLKDGSTFSNLDTGGASTPWYLLDVSSVEKCLLWQVRKDYEFKVMNANDAGNVQGFMTEQHLIGTRARVVAGAGSPFRIYKSNQALTPDNYQDARATMRAYKGDSGRPIRVRPRVLMVPPSLEKLANEIVAAERNTAGASNVLVGTAQVVVNEYLQDTP